MKSVMPPKSDTRSATIVHSLGLIAAFSGLLALTVSASDPAWWSSPGTGTQGAVVAEQVVTNGGVVTTNYIPNDNAVVTQGQLKQFTVRAVDELNAYFGAGTNLNALASNWAAEYATNGYNATNLEPSDRTVMTVGQLKYIASLVYGQLSAGGYSGLTPSWLVPDTNSDNTAATLGQLMTVFDFDLSTAPGPVTGVTATPGNPDEIALTWTLPAMNNATSILVEISADGGTTWATVTTLDPAETGYVVVGLSASGSYQFQVTLSNNIGPSTPSGTGPSATPARPSPRYAVIDLGLGYSPTKITDSGYVLMADDAGSYTRWYNGTSTNLVAGESAFTNAFPSGIPETDPYIAYTYWSTHTPGAGWTFSAQPGTYTGNPQTYIASDITEGGVVEGVQDYEEIEFDYKYTSAGPPYVQTSGSDYSAGYMCRAVWPADTDTSTTVLASSAGYAHAPGIWAPGSGQPTIPVFAYGTNATTATVNSVETTMTDLTDPTRPYNFDLYLNGVDQNKVCLGIWAGNNSGDLGSLVQGTNYLNSTALPSDLYPGFISNTNSVSPAVVFGGSPNGMTWWDGSEHVLTTPGGVYLGALIPAGVNAATNQVTISGTLTTKPAHQIVAGTYSAGYLWEMNPTNGVFNPPLVLDDLVSATNGWSGISPGIFGVRRNAINDDGVIVGYATKTSDSSSHGIMLIPDKIQRDGQDITTNSNTVWVGQQICLTNIISGFPSNAVTSYEWVIPGATNGIAFKDYQPTAEKSNYTNLAPSDLTNNYCNFYWSNGGSNQVVYCTNVIYGQTNVVSTTFNVSRPTGKITATFGSIAADTNSYVPAEVSGLPWLHFGTDGIPPDTHIAGAHFSETISPGYLYGTNSWIQILDNVIDNQSSPVTNNSFVVYPVAYDGSDFPYPTGIVDAVDATDSPGVALPRWATSASKYFQATMYLMWTPSTNVAGMDNVVPVPLRAYRWEWSASATNSSAFQNGDGTWTNYGTGWTVVSPIYPSHTNDASYDTNWIAEPIWYTNAPNEIDIGG